ncbi:MAG: TIGR02266 family protein, partial [Myxococcaceae bacterium]
MFAPTPLRVRLPFRSEDEFVDQYGAHVGRDGFFLATRAPKPVGAQLLFDLVLADGSSLLRGEGVVVKSNATGERPGMTLRFVRLEAAGKALVERILSSRPARGSAPADAHAHPSAWAPPTGRTAAPPAAARRDPVPRPAGPADWAPPAASVRPEPPAPSPEPAQAPPSEPSRPDAPAELGPAEGAKAELPEMAAAWERDDAARASEAPVAAAPETPSAPEASAPVSDAGISESTSPLETTPRLDTRPDLATTPVLEAPALLGTSPALETAPAVDGTLPGPAPAHTPEEVPAELHDRSAGAAPEFETRSTASATEGGLTEDGPGSSVATRSDDSGPDAPAAGTSATDAIPLGGGSPAPRPEEAPIALPGPEPRPDRAPSADLPAPLAPDTAAAAHPPLDESELPELVVTEFKGPGPLRPAGLEHTPASADVHAAITPPAGTLVVTELDEPPPEEKTRFQLDAPVRGDEPLALPESSFHDVDEALAPGASVHDRPTTPIPLLYSMETAALDEVPIPPPPPPLDVAPIPEEGAVRIEPGAPEPPPAPPTPVATRDLPALDTEIDSGAAETAPTPAPDGASPPATPRTSVAGTAALGIEINPESIRVCWFHDGRSEPLLLDPGHGRTEAPVRLVREPGAPPRMLSPDAPDPALWVGAPLSFLGLRAESDASRTVARRWPAAVVPDDRGEAAFALEGGTVGATELLAALLRWVRHRAEELTSQPPGRVVITVPVAFNALQRERLREAAERAGLEGVRLVQAPTAATMAFAHGRGLARRRILVWRLGASTCDIAVLAAAGDDLDMVACAGDAALGSVNFDEQIALALDKGARADATVLRKRIAEAAQLRTQLEDSTLTEATVEGAHLTRVELEARTT